MRMKSQNWKLYLGAALILTLCAASSAQMTEYEENQRLATTEAHVNGRTGHAEAAKMNYRRYCLGCHGELGDGEGENAIGRPKPRNFTLGIFKCRSTPTGTLPTDEDLYDTIGRGLITSNMPQWLPLTAQDRVDLVAYVKHFSRRFATEKPGPSIQIPPGTGNYAGPCESRTGCFRSGAVLEVSRRYRARQWTVGVNPPGRPWESHQTV